MDGQRFDELARSLAEARSRRAVVKGLTGGLLGGLAALLGGRGRAGADDDDDDDDCRRTGRSCRRDGQCCRGSVCGPGGTCQAGCRVGGTFYAPGAANPANPCQTCQPTRRTTAFLNANGAPCDTGNACTQDTCAQGRCVQGPDTVTPTCTSPGLCEAATGTCDPGTGGCVYADLPDTTPCSTGDRCKANETCQGGSCVGTDVACAAPTCVGNAEVRSTCSSATGCASGPPKDCGLFACAEGTGCPTRCAGDGDCLGTAYCTPVGTCADDLARGAACQTGAQCASGNCVDGVCCETASCGRCQACDVAGSEGVCTLKEGLACTPSDACFEGICTNTGACFQVGPPKTCPSDDPCRRGVCRNGQCGTEPNPAAGSCGPGGACFEDVCRNGVCTQVAKTLGGSCGGTECNPKVCQGTSCVDAPERANGQSCGGTARPGLCSNGTCCRGAADEGVCSILGACCADTPCFQEESTSGDPSAVCCPPQNLCPPTDPNAGQCCYSNESCIGVGTGYACIDTRLLCGGVPCNGECCGTTCCPDGTYCNGTSCVAVTTPPGGCTTDADCGAPGRLSCVGEAESAPDFETGETTVAPGFCCPTNRSCPSREPGPPDGAPYDFCAPYGFRCGGPNGETCSVAYNLACGGNCFGCSPRGARIRF